MELDLILIDGIIYSLQRTGGITVLFNEIVSRLPQQEFEIVCYGGAKFSGTKLVKSRLAERYRDARVHRKYDVFHSTYYRLPSVSCGKVVTTVHDYTYERFLRGTLRGRVHSWQKNRAVAGADRIICVSESTKQDLIQFSGAQYESRAVVIPNGVSEGFFPDRNVRIESQVLFVGARGGYKNFHAVVVAIEGLKDVGLVLVGGGPLTKDEHSLLQRHVPGRFAHRGYLSEAELNSEYNRSICLVYPSLYEGFGIPVLEAMRAGCAVVAVDSSSIPEVAGTAALLMERGAPEEVRQAIEFLMVEENRHRYRSQGFSRSKQFSWDITYKRTAKLYEELLGYELT